jgi:glutamine amidotransferase
VSKIDNQNGKFKLPHIGWNELNIVKNSQILKDIKNKSHMYFVHSYEFIPEDKNVISSNNRLFIEALFVLLKKKIYLAHNFTLKKVTKRDLK